MISDYQRRIRGALLGLACGDALGAPAEFKPQSEVRAKWGRLTEMVGGGVWEPGEWTDDTGMALCVAEGCLAAPDDPIEEIGNRFLAWRKAAKDVGSTIAAALSAYAGDWHAAARKTPQAKSGKAAGNGSLMRTIPIPLIYSDRNHMLEISARVSAMTHWDIQGETCCAIYGLWIARLLQGEPLRESWFAALDEAENGTGVSVVSPDLQQKAPSALWDRLRSAPGLTYERLQPTGYAGYVVDCLEAAVWCAVNAESYETAVVEAVNLGGEADTIAAVAGGAAGAHWGEEAIPDRWLQALHQRQRIEAVADRTGELRRHIDVYTMPGLPPFQTYMVTDRILCGRNPLTSWDIRTLAESGITHIVDLREEHEWSAPGRIGAEAVEAGDSMGLSRLPLPIQDTGAPKREDFDRAYEFISSALAHPTAIVFVHCRAGRERTAAIVIACQARLTAKSFSETSNRLREACPSLNPLPDQTSAAEEWVANHE